MPRAPHALPARVASRNPNVGSGSKIDVQTVLKLIDDAITATQRLVGRELRQRDVVEVERLPGVLVVRRHAREHLLLVGPHDRAAVRGRERRARRARRRAHRRRSRRGWRRSRRHGDGTVVPPRSATSYHSMHLTISQSRRRSAMPGSVIVSSARTPIGKLSGALASLRRHRPRWRTRSGPRSSGPGSTGDQVDYVLHGPGAAGRRGPDARAPGRGEGRHPDVGAVDDDQQGVPLRASTRSTSPTR